MSQSGKLTPNLDPKSTKTLNLTVLQRIDPLIEQILMTAAHVTFYEFNTESSQWSRKDVEGSLFVVKRNAHPRFQFIVMNRRNTDNLVENLDGPFEFEVQLPYLLYRNAAQEVSGIWFYNAPECEEAGNLFSRILNECSKTPQNPKISSNKRECEELEAVPSMAAMGGPREPLSALPTSTHTPQDQSFLDLFNAAINSASNNNSTISNPRYSHHCSATLPVCSNSSTVTSIATAPQKPSTQTLFCETSDPLTRSGRAPKLVKPSSFYEPPAPSSATPAAAQRTPLNLQLHHGSPLLQPFPPPTPPPSLTPVTAPPHGLATNKERVRDALLMLAQDDLFIEMFYQALQRVHHTSS